jgi:hypothetical protein
VDYYASSWLHVRLTPSGVLLEKMRDWKDVPITGKQIARSGFFSVALGSVTRELRTKKRFVMVQARTKSRVITSFRIPLSIGSQRRQEDNKELLT